MALGDMSVALLGIFLKGQPGASKSVDNLFIGFVPWETHHFFLNCLLSAEISYVCSLLTAKPICGLTGYFSTLPGH